MLQAAPAHVARGILQAPILEASTFPGDAIYIPDSWFARLRLCSNEHARHEEYSRVRALDMHTPIHRWHTVHSHGGEADRNIAVGVHWQMFVGNQEFPLRCGTYLACLFCPHGVWIFCTHLPGPCPHAVSSHGLRCVVRLRCPSRATRMGLAFKRFGMRETVR